MCSHSPYFPDIRPSDYHLFLNFNHLRNRLFNSREDVATELQSFFNIKNRGFYKNVIDGLFPTCKSLLHMRVIILMGKNVFYLIHFAVCFLSPYILKPIFIT